MKITKYMFTLLAMLLVANVAFAQSDSDQDDKDLPTADSVVMKHVEKTGGIENYKNIKTMVASATLSIPSQGIEGEMEMKMMLPKNASVVQNIAGAGETIQGTNGKYSWMSNAMMGGPQLIDGKMADQVKSQLDMGRYTNPKKFYKSMKNAGVEEANGEDAYKIELVKQNGDKQTEFYSVKTGLLIQSVVTVESGMGEMTVTSKIGDYRETGKFKAAFKMVQVLPVAGGMEIVIAFDKFKYNAKLDASEFAPPEGVQELIDAKEKKAKEKDVEKVID